MAVRNRTTGSGWLCRMRRSFLQTAAGVLAAELIAAASGCLAETESWQAALFALAASVFSAALTGRRELS